jgi:threonine aldolase
VCVEQTHNFGAGSIWPREQLDAVAHLAHERRLKTHMDGARLLNACVATGVSAREMAAGWDSVWIDFTKGLGAPIGAALAGSRDFIDRVWRWKQRLGGALRQGGIAAAGCLHALDHHVDRLADDHANARTLARGLSQIEGLDVQQPETNLVYIGAKGGALTPSTLQAELRKRGVLVSLLGGRVRACTHIDVTAAMVEETVTLAREIARGHA